MTACDKSPTTRRDFIRRGALWLAAGTLVEPVARKLWAFPTNPVGPQRMTDAAYQAVFRDVGNMHVQVWSELGTMMRALPVVEVGNGVWGATLTGVRPSDRLVLVSLADAPQFRGQDRFHLSADITIYGNPMSHGGSWDVPQPTSTP